MLKTRPQSDERKQARKESLREFDRSRHFEALLMQSFTEMRARSTKG